MKKKIAGDNAGKRAFGILALLLAVVSFATAAGFFSVDENLYRIIATFAGAPIPKSATDIWIFFMPIAFFIAYATFDTFRVFGKTGKIKVKQPKGKWDWIGELEASAQWHKEKDEIQKEYDEVTEARKKKLKAELAFLSLSFGIGVAIALFKALLGGAGATPNITVPFIFSYIGLFLLNKSRNFLKP